MGVPEPNDGGGISGGACLPAGYIDNLSDRLLVCGWAWCPASPDERLEVAFFINGARAGQAGAHLYRKDVADAGNGDGHYGFAWPLSLQALTGTGEIVISAREARTGLEFPTRLSLSPGDLAGRLAAFAARPETVMEVRLEALRAALRLAPEEPWHAMALAVALGEAGSAAESATVLQALLARHPAFWHGHVALGHLARQAGERAQALDWFRQAARLVPEDVWRWLDIAEEERALGLVEEARRSLLRAGALEPDLWAVELGLGYCARALAEHHEARRHFETAARRAPEELAPRLGLIEALRDSGALDEAREAALALLRDHPGHLPLLLNLAQTERQAGQEAEAARWFVEALALEPDNPTLLAELARQEYRLGRQRESNEHLTRALALDPGHVDAVTQLASQALTVGDAAQAHDIYRAAAGRRPGELAFRFGMLDTLAWQGRIQDALAGLQAVELEHGVTPQLQSWRITLLRRTGQMDEALRAAREATAAAPQQTWLWNERFQTELLAGSDAMVQKCLFGIPAATRPEHAIKRRSVGALAESLWQIDCALEYYEGAAGLNPNDAGLQEALTRVKLMRLDLPGARRHLRRHYELVAAERRLRGESLNISQSLLGQMIDEYALDQELAGAIHALSVQPARNRLEPLAALVREAPDSTAPAASLLLAMRQAEGLEFIPQAEGAPAIPRVINAFWDRPEPPEDVADMMRSWRDRNPDYEWRCFDEARARAYLASKFPGPVSQAYQRVREIPQKADLFRLALLVAEGGIYADADDRCLRALDMVLPRRAALVLAQEEFGCAANHFIAAVPGHPVLQAALRAVVTALNRGDNEIPWLLSGPGLLTRVLAQYLAMRGVLAGLPPGVALLDRRALGHGVASGCFATYKSYNMRHRKRIDAAAGKAS
ncbi:glycosyltransferase [Acidocella sp.]|uniref:glycosyltransferase n=1 Tax=Acidocella sp. TaxID=50710 RepID=UPI003D023CE7